MSHCVAMLALSLVLLEVSCGSCVAEKPLVFVVLDGFRWDYQELLPAGREGSFHMLETSGVRAEYVFPVFPSVSYASWTSIATGRWVETHGILGNNFFDHELGPFMLYNKSLTGLPAWWNAGSEPIWTTATRQRVKTAVIGFSRCDVPVSGVKPAFCRRFEKLPSREDMRDHFNMALRKLEEGFQFVIVYAEYVDTLGHYQGPESRKMLSAIRGVDEELAAFFDGLRRRRLLDKVNFVMASDHGMTEIGEQVATNYIYLDLYLSPLLAERIIERGAFTQIIPLPGRRDMLLEELERMPNVTVYTKGEFPEEWHYSDHPRIPEIMVLADPGTVIMGPQTENTLPRDPAGAWDQVRGIHGYTRNHTDMRTIFYAMGPDFKDGYRQPPMELIDTYQVLAHVLDIEPQPHNGSWERVRDMLSPAAAPSPSLGGAAVLPLVALAAGSLMTAC
ncbi:glycerophosphocholine cholinephosphodiesterase ENPP6-like [Pollicipes pollicipes]|uniref:glycerophosphocholine cholinephosphodiesterase ENPP6-like n=1 Tax=Pollicipes pollicipes TaxID=41117 RepID=UPI0018858E99|nr:glycerophosphocholine cholinephosphodiesterase ENPP6-like [Pollicipes pollicipes]